MVIVICSGKENTKKKSKIVEEIVHYVEAVSYTHLGFCGNAKIADELEKMEAIDKFLSFALSVEGGLLTEQNQELPLPGHVVSPLQHIDLIAVSYTHLFWVKIAMRMDI